MQSKAVEHTGTGLSGNPKFLRPLTHTHQTPLELPCAGLWKWLATGGELRAGAAGPPPAPIRSGGNSFGGQGRGRAKGRGRHWGDKGRRSFPPVSGAAEGAAEGGVGANSLAEVALESAVQVADSAVGEEQCAGGFVGNDGIDGICQPVDT